jgi:hypothetical protein
MANNHAMFASEVIDKSTVLGAGDERRAHLAAADGHDVAVISGCAVCWADVAKLPATASAVGEESVVEKPELASPCEVPVTDHGAKNGRTTHQRSPCLKFDL